MGNREHHALVTVASGCRCGCAFCTHSNGKTGLSLDDAIGGTTPLPDCRIATIMAGDVMVDALGPLVSRLAASGTEEIFVYAHPGCDDVRPMKALRDAGATGIHLVLPAVERQALAAICGPSAVLANIAMIIKGANYLGMKVMLEIPVLSENLSMLADIAERALGMIDRPAGISLPFRATHDANGPRAWDFRLAVPHVRRVLAIAAGKGVPVTLGGPEGAAPCVLNLPDADIAWYPDLDSGARTGDGRGRPLEECASCLAATACNSLMQGFARALDLPLRPVDDTTPARPPAAASSATLFVRRSELDGLLARAAGIDRCTAPWDSLEAHDRTGRVTPCEGSWPRRDVIGTPDCESGRGWLDAGLLESFNSPAMTAMRRAMVSGGRGATCNHTCPRFHETWAIRPPTRLARSAVFHENLVLNLREFIDGAEILESRPLNITISPSLRCNQRCRMCDLDDEDAGATGIDVPDRILDEVIELLPTTATLAFTGGEPLTSRRTMEIIGRITPDAFPDTRVTLTTNGTLLTPAAIAGLSGSNVAAVFISINAATAETHAIVSGVQGRFDKVMNNARAMIEAAGRMPLQPDVVLSFVVMRSTIAELGAFLDLAYGMGAGVRLLPIERDRLGESIFTNRETLDAAAALIRGLLERDRLRRPRQAGELARLDRLIRAKMADDDLSPI